MLTEGHAFARHDHRACRSGALERAERLSRERGARLTPARRRVLEILLEGHKALGAYDVLERLAGAGHGATPPVAYRALNFLVEQGFAHRIERLNAFVACVHDDGVAHDPVFLICRACHRVAEGTDAARPGLEKAAAEAGFTIERTMVEVEGLCPACRAAEA